MMSWGEVGGRKRGREGKTQKMRLWDILSDLMDKNRTIRKRERAGTCASLHKELGHGGWRGKRVTCLITKVEAVHERRIIVPQIL